MQKPTLEEEKMNILPDNFCLALCFHPEDLSSLVFSQLPSELPDTDTDTCAATSVLHTSVQQGDNQAIL